MAEIITPADAAQEILTRRAARKKLIDYAQYVVPNYDTPPHIRYLCNALERVESGEVSRLMIFMPPQHGKSMLASTIFPCWYLGRHPEAKIIQTGHTHDLCVTHSRKARDIFVTPENRVLFPDVHYNPAKPGQRHLPANVQSADMWGTMQRGEYYAVGVNGSIQGHGMNIGIIDDPYKNMGQVRSKTYQQNLLELYQATLLTRLAHDGAIIFIMQRWAANDLAGQLLEIDGTDRWTIVSFPAIAEDHDILGRKPGEALWPAQKPLKFLLDLKKTMTSMQWAALYQQEPRGIEGTVIKRDWFIEKIFTAFPPADYTVRYWDLACSSKTSADRTCGAKAHFGQKDVHGDRDFIVDHMLFGRWEWPEAKKIIIETARLDGPNVEIGVEEVGMQLALVQELKNELEGKGFRVRGVPTDRDKYSRALPWVGRAEHGNMKLREGRWNQEALDEWCSFTGNGNEPDDLVDGVSGAHAMLNDRVSIPGTTGGRRRGRV